ncbi:sigma-54-dependent transcriptional regulator [Desulfofustis glycolicus]|uniref:DNA-binding transcriptional response regulator, NtrC family, contains REC, AAA-type ATPase, and a Fis-type DNA-binding domains n=1 Tax=Desulfofustis glycolicus DSM 9705 TaxID=1121409 RepID=A0A1M5YGR6_9BACT|nr:sigma-54 dependent transcriptional regulator [Desulfofustis glycolicus]MCB2217801.1 sigma-54 dependent transcriptional regulator [Desulfobulbaceae bacterium]SHI11225.1 DNA-binding transcriptional response regulator, NtrC family, contains REC, AAA-type ATPase, and a Fis-type DNA-binding domains [Desulfofustis glycolicus DSM 9705]
MNILVIDDEPDIRLSLSSFLKRLGHSVNCAENGEEGLKLFHSNTFEIVITDIRMPIMGGLELLKQIKRVERSPIDVIVFTGHGDMDSAVKALQYGAYDYLQKPINVKELAITLERAEEYAVLRNNYIKLKKEFKDRIDEAVHSCRGEAERLRDAYLSEIGLGELCVFSEGMRRVLNQAEKYSSDRNVPVLIEGESGTGKELIARYIHHYNPISNESPFVAINCGALSEALIESELFGHEHGAFTGAAQGGRIGKFEAAEGGTVFLDEIGEMPINLQVKLLRVLEEKKFFRLGGIKEVPVNIRFLCATNRDLQEAVKEKKFRLDLYYRISTGNIKIPPLRLRSDAILPFANRFASRAFKRQGKRFEAFSSDAEKFLKNYSWPGNVRQIKNAMERLSLLKSDGNIDLSDLNFLDELATKTISNTYHLGDLPSLVEVQNLPDHGLDIEQLNRNIVFGVLQKCKGNQTKTAEYLGISRRQLQGRLKKWNIQCN